MATKSALLEYILSSAMELVEAKGAKLLNANYFITQLLHTINEYRAGRFPDELNTEENRLELASAVTILEGYHFDFEEKEEELRSFIMSDKYKHSDMEAFIFKKIDYSDKLVSDDVVRQTSFYLEKVLAEPTTMIEDNIIALSGGSVSAEELDKMVDVLKEVYQEGDTDSAEQTAESADTASEEPATGIGKLSELVKATRNIQTSLLECVFGQDQAVNAFTSGYFQAQLMRQSRRNIKTPQATFLFAGPPGVGKTFLAEKVAETLGLPYQRFDMSEYSDKEANVEFCGSDKVYKGAKSGNVTSFVAFNPKCVLLFDEIEKAHINVIHLFLQILDAGRLRDNFTDEEVSFTDAVIIFTTNVGRNLYEDPTITNLAAVPRKKVLKALSTDKDPNTGAPLFPGAICSRFASGNVVMFNHLDATNLYTIASSELNKNLSGFTDSTGISVTVDGKVPAALMFSEGGRADARTVKGRANSFFHEELYELFRLLASEGEGSGVEGLRELKITVPTEELVGDAADMFQSNNDPEVLIFASEELCERCRAQLDGVRCHTASSFADAREILFNNDVDIVLCDVNYNVRSSSVKLLNAEDISSEGQDFLSYVLEKYSLPTYILTGGEGRISNAEMLSFAKLGVRDVIAFTDGDDSFCNDIISRCRTAYQQGKMLKLARENKALSYKTAQTISDDGSVAEIRLFGFRLRLITDTEDSASVVDDVSRPDVRFDDVIGAEDAKEELKYFVEYLRNPVQYMRRGVRSPKGVLLYGPPGTGKTLLAKAMAGESGVTFLRAEGNGFLKRYVGEGPEAVHSLFNAARKYAPSIIFIDEIDAIGKSRSDSDSGDSAANVLTALLTEMDGFNTDTTKPVFVLAATNYGVDSDSDKRLDDALLRRFDRLIYVDLPNREERKRYLKLKLRKYSTIQLSDDQIDSIAMRSTGMSLASLESIIEMALRSAIRSESGVVGDAEFEEAFETFNSGEKKEWSGDSLLCTARHEAGHALLSWLSGDRPSYLTIVARGNHGGYMQHSDSEDKGSYTRAELIDSIRTSLAGRAAELVYYGAEDGLSTGASGDLRSATSLAERMICQYGMDSSVGLASYPLRYATDAYCMRVIDRVNEILAEEMKHTIATVTAHKDAIDSLVEALMDKNHLKENEIDQILSAAIETATK